MQKNNMDPCIEVKNGSFLSALNFLKCAKAENIEFDYIKLLMEERYTDGAIRCAVDAIYPGSCLAQAYELIPVPSDEDEGTSARERVSA